MTRGRKVFLTLAFLMTLIIASFIFIKPKPRNLYTEWAAGKLGTQEGYSVIVVGSDPEGIAAAISAARSGAKTLLLGKEDAPGGLLTYGMLNTLDMNRGAKGELLTRGIFSEFYAKIGNTESFDVEQAKSVFTEMINAESKLTYLSNYKFKSPIMEGNTIIGVEMSNNNGQVEKFFAKRIIDATQDGDICAAAGAPYYVGMEDVHCSERMAATLVFKVANVDWNKLRSDVERYKREADDFNAGINESTAWAFGEWCYDKYKPLHSNMKLRGLNIGLQKDSTVLINALQIFGVDWIDEKSRAKAMADATEEVENVVEYLKKLLPSFENAKLISVADDLYIRESRHIQGEYVLTATDLLANKNFKDKIALGSYPIDIQSTSVKNTGYVIGAPTQYTVPLRCTIPLNVENLFIVGKAASYTSIAAGSVRVVPVGMVVGESCGMAAVYSITRDITPRELSKDAAKVEQLQGILKDQGVYLPEFKLTDPNANVVGYRQIKKLINLGFLSGGYTNNFGFEKPATVGNLSMAIVNGLQRGGNEKYDIPTVRRITSYSDEKITAVRAGFIVAKFLGHNFDEVPTFIDYDKLTDERLKAKGINKEDVPSLMAEEERKREIVWSFVKGAGYLDKMAEDFEKEQVLNRRQAYELAVNTLELYLGHEI